MQCLLQKDNKSHLSLFPLIWSVETSCVLQVCKAVEEKLESEKKLPQSYFYQAYFSSPQVVEWSPSDGRRGKEGVKLQRGEMEDLCMENTEILNCQSFIHVQGDQHRHFSVPKLEDFSIFTSFLFFPHSTRGKIMIRAVRQAYNILKVKMTCISTFLSLKDLIVFTYMKLGFQNCWIPLSHMLFLCQDFSTILWEESVYIEYQTLFFCMYYVSDCGAHTCKQCLKQKTAALDTVGLPGGRKVPKMCVCICVCVNPKM